jgi:Zn-dependent protease with chaperone function
MRIKEQKWRINAFQTDVEQELAVQLEDASAGEIEATKVWTQKENYGLHRRVVEYDSSEGVVKEEIHVCNHLIKFFPVLISLAVLPILYLLTIDAPLYEYTMMMSAEGMYDSAGLGVLLIMLGLWGCLVMRFISSGPDLQLKLDEIGVSTDSRANRYFRFAVVLGYTLIGLTIISMFSSSRWLKLGPIVLASFVWFLHHWRPAYFSSPTGSWPLAMSLVPFLGSVWMLLPVVSVWMYSYTFGISVRYYTDLSYAFLREAAIYGIWAFVLVGAVYSVAVTVGLYRASFKLYQGLMATQSEWFERKSIRYGVLSIYVLVNLVGVVAGLIAVDVIYYGITSSSLLRSSVIGVLFQGQLTVMYESYGFSRAIFNAWPLVSPREYLVSFYALLFSPAFFFLGMWIYGTGEHIYSSIRTFLEIRDAERLDSQVVPDSVIIAVSDRGALPNAHAGSLFFGWKRYIVVTRSLIDTVSEQELNAVLAHEAYHIQNRDWLANLLASMFSVLFGGQSSLQIFYDYPRVELEADEYAVEMVGADPLHSALENLELKTLKMSKGSDPSEDRPTGVRRWLSRIQTYLTAPYRLFFSSVVLDVSHRSPSERRELIAE